MVTLRTSSGTSAPISEPAHSSGGLGKDSLGTNPVFRMHFRTWNMTSCVFSLHLLPVQVHPPCPRLPLMSTTGWEEGL